MNDAFIFDAVRTPRGRGKPNGSLHEITPIKLASSTLSALKKRNNINTDFIDDVILGCVHPVNEQGGDIARLAVLDAEFSESVSGAQVDRFCASGLEACNIAAGQIMSGQSDMTIGGGVESMSRVPMGSSGGAWMHDPREAFETYFVPQGISADLLATKYNYSRDDVDSYAVKSQLRAKKAWNEKRFSNSVIEIKDQNGLTILNHDEHIRPDTSMQSLASLEPSFKDFGKNSKLNDIAIRAKEFGYGL